jgi:hypothetical protein
MENVFPKILRNFRALETSMTNMLKGMFRQGEVVINFMSGFDERIQNNLKFVNASIIRKFSTDLNSTQLQIVSVISQKVDILSVNVQDIRKSVNKSINNGMQNLLNKIEHGNETLINNFGNNLEKLMNQFRTEEVAEHMDIKNLIEFSFNNSNDKITSELIKLGETTEGNLLVLDKNLVIFYEEFMKQMQIQFESFDNIRNSFTQFEIDGRRRENENNINLAKETVDKENHHKAMLKGFKTTNQFNNIIIQKIEEVSTKVEANVTQVIGTESKITSIFNEGRLSIKNSFEELEADIKQLLKETIPTSEGKILAKLDEGVSMIKNEIVEQESKMGSKVIDEIHESERIIKDGFERSGNVLRVLQERVSKFDYGAIAGNLQRTVDDSVIVINALGEEWNASNKLTQRKLDSIGLSVNVMQDKLQEVVEQGNKSQEKLEMINNTINQNEAKTEGLLGENLMQSIQIEKSISKVENVEQEHHQIEMNALNDVTLSLKKNEETMNVLKSESDDLMSGQYKLISNVQGLGQEFNDGENIILNAIGESDSRRNLDFESITNWFDASYNLIYEANSKIESMLNLSEENKNQNEELMKQNFENFLQICGGEIRDVYNKLTCSIESLKEYLLQSNQATRETISNVNLKTNSIIREVKKFLADNAQLIAGKTKDQIEAVYTNLVKAIGNVDEAVKKHVDARLQELFNGISEEMQKLVTYSNETRNEMLNELMKMNASEALRKSQIMGVN